jgi:RNA polymerase sigma-70 factor (ECF subfamily)
MQSILPQRYNAETLLVALKNSDRKAQKHLYESYAKAMYNVALRITGDEDDAKHLLQESFVRVFTGIDKFSQPEKMPGWIKKITVNTALNLLAKQKRKLKFQDELKEEYYGTEENFEEEHLLKIEAVKKAVNKLPDGFRIIFSLYVFEGYDHAEIAEILGISESTSKSQLLRARQKIYALLPKN